MMGKHKQAMMALSMTTALCHPAVAEARDTVVVLSPNQESAALQAQIETVIGHLTQTLALGERAIFVDGANARLAAEFVVPDREAYENPRAKLQANGPALRDLKQVIDRAQDGAATIDMAATLRTVRETFPAADGGSDMIVLASPIATPALAPHLSMRDGRIPSDGHIAAAAGDSPYGASGISGSLEGYEIHWGLIGPDWAISTAHAHHVERFWTLTAEAHGASMAYFGDDLRTMFRNTGGDVPDRQHAEPLQPEAKVEMLQFAADGGAVAALFSDPLVTGPASELTWRSASGVRIGITWPCRDCDIDLYVRPNPRAPVIYFGQPATAEGRLFKDFTNSPVGGYETVALVGEANLGEVRLALNLYRGNVPQGGVEGEIRIAIGEDIRAMPFTIPASVGNRGDGAESVILDGVAANDAWVVIDPLEVIGVW